MNKIIQIYGFSLIELMIKHMAYVFISVGIALVGALLVGVLLSRKRKNSSIIIEVLSTFLNVSGLIFIGIVSIFLRDSRWTLLIGLTLCGFFPILKYSYIGLINVDLQYIEAAKGCGMSPRQTLKHVEIPLAMPMIFKGLRQGVRFTNSWAMIAPIIGQSSLGQFIYTGIITNNYKLILIGLVPSILVGIILHKTIDFIEKRIVSSGLSEYNYSI